jgi:DNA helicase-2/ATP-dependent DNA helicase PcrA
VSNLDNLYGIDDRTAAFERHSNGLLVSLAGPGTGKTYSFLQRIRYLTESDQASPDEICYLTFIKEISKAFLSDYHQEFAAEPGAVSSPRISTLHSFACRLIRNRGFSIGFDGPLYFTSIADRDQPASEVFLSDLLPLLSGFSSITLSRLRGLLATAKQAWRDNVDPTTLRQPIPPILANALMLARCYRLIDWDQAVPLAHTLYLNPANRERWITQLCHFLIDEYQDFNAAEQSFIATLLANVTSMIIVGDDNQSIYSGRGASPVGIADLFRSPNVDQVSLLRCRRSKATILQAVNTFLLFMRPDAQPLVPHDPGGEIHSYRFKSCKAELAFLAEYLSQAIANLPASPRPKDGIICLFPTKKALGFYYNCLRSSVACTVRNPAPHPDRLFLSLLLELVANPYQRFIERLILEHFTEIKPRHKEAMVRLILAEDISPSQALTRLVDTQALDSSAAITAARAFSQLCQALSSQDPDAIADIVPHHLPVNQDQLRDCIIQLINDLPEVEHDDAISNACDQLLPQFAAPPEDPCSVLFLTIHSSKGLTKHTVVMPGLEDAWLPGQAVGVELDEKKRLFYVALTRATDRVLITHPGTRSSTRSQRDPLNYNTPGRGQVSRFVNDSRIPTVYHA